MACRHALPCVALHCVAPAARLCSLIAACSRQGFCLSRARAEARGHVVLHAEARVQDSGTRGQGTGAEQRTINQEHNLLISQPPGTALVAAHWSSAWLRNCPPIRRSGYLTSWKLRQLTRHRSSVCGGRFLLLPVCGQLLQKISGRASERKKCSTWRWATLPSAAPAARAQVADATPPRSQTSPQEESARCAPTAGACGWRRPQRHTTARRHARSRARKSRRGWRHGASRRERRVAVFADRPMVADRRAKVARRSAKEASQPARPPGSRLFASRNCVRPRVGDWRLATWTLGRADHDGTTCPSDEET